MLFNLGSLLAAQQQAPNDLSFGVGTSGGFTGGAMPGADALAKATMTDTPTAGMFAGAGGMNPMMMAMAAQAMQGMGKSNAPVQQPQFGQYADPQALVQSAPTPSNQLVGRLLMGGQ